MMSSKSLLPVFFCLLVACKRNPDQPATISRPPFSNAPAIVTNTALPSAPVTNLPPITNKPIVLQSSTNYPAQDLYERAVEILKVKNSDADLKEAISLFQKAADAGNPAAEHALGVSYLEGLGVAKNQDEGIKWLKKAAEDNFPEAQFKLAGLYARGTALKQDPAAAAEWVRKAAEQGHIEAEYNLATLYAAGRGVPVDATNAAIWFKKAAEGGHPT